MPRDDTIPSSSRRQKLAITLGLISRDDTISTTSRRQNYVDHFRTNVHEMIQSQPHHEDNSLRITLGLMSRDDTIPLQHHHHCSPFRGRSFQTIPSLSRKYSNFTRDRGLVHTSVLTYWSFIAPFCTISHM